MKLRVGSCVRRVADVGTGKKLADVQGVVVKITKRKLSGGTRAIVRVRWENGHTGSVEDRQIVVVKGCR